MLFLFFELVEELHCLAGQQKALHFLFAPSCILLFFSTSFRSLNEDKANIGEWGVFSSTPTTFLRPPTRLL